MFGIRSYEQVTTYLLILLLLFGAVRFFISLAHKFLRERKQTVSNEEQPMEVDVFLNGVQYAVSYWNEKGGRPYQEDRHFAIRGGGYPDSSLYGVFDGHGGFRAAQYCKENLLHYVVQDPNFKEDPASALSAAFFRADAEFSAMARMRMLSDGTTAVVACIHNSKIYVANAGDSRGIIVQKGGRFRRMSIDHKPDREDEEQRIKKLGGKIVHWGRWRVEGILAVSRAIGDVSLQPYVTCEPEILEKNISPEDEYLVLASDGLWDAMRNEEVARRILVSASNDFKNISKILCTEALIAGSTDNVTVLVIDLRQRIKNIESE